jgi:hypothetical protein
MGFFVLTPTSELEAVNACLRAVGEAPVSTVSGSTTQDVTTAKKILSDVSRRVQSSGWNFNTDYNVSLPLNASNEIVLASNVLSVSVPHLDVDIRDGKMYDRYNHVSTFTTGITGATVVYLLEFTHLPQTARDYITQLACRQMQQEIQGQVSADQENAEELRRSRAEFIDDESFRSRRTMGNSEQDMFNMTLRDKLQR